MSDAAPRSDALDALDEIEGAEIHGGALPNARALFATIRSELERLAAHQGDGGEALEAELDRLTIKIAANLFTNGQGRRASRLVLVDESDGRRADLREVRRDLGGLGEVVVQDRIRESLAALRVPQAGVAQETAQNLGELAREIARSIDYTADAWENVPRILNVLGRAGAHVPRDGGQP